jgi:signal transduction histidine kinase
VNAGPGRDVTVVQREGSPPVAIEHDAQLNDDPELLNAAGAVALLAAENAELDAGWNDAIRDLEHSRMHLEDSRSRLVRAADEERRKVERNLHDGIQHRLIAIMIRLGMAAEDATIDPRPANGSPSSPTTWTGPSRRYARCHTASTHRS